MGDNDGVSVLELRGVSKHFGPVVALRNGALTLRSGSIHALIGENGAGKSTVVKIIAGLYQPDDGEMILHGKPVRFHSTAEAKSAGIAVIYQEPTLFPDLSVAENVFMGRYPKTKLGWIDRGAMRAQVEALMDRLGVHLDPDRLAAKLSIADQQIIEIAKAISLDASILIMDEPTAALSSVEVDRLFAVARSLRDAGKALLFISHRFEEIFSLCDTVTVMRDGSYISTQPIASTTETTLMREMVGRDINELFPKVPADIGQPVLEVSHLTSLGAFNDISLTVRSGEIVALAGLVGAGRSEVARAIFGVDSYDSGTVTICGEPLPKRNPRASMKSGLALVPEDRRKQGLIMDAPVLTNVTDAIRHSLSHYGFITSAMETKPAASWATALEVKTSALDALASTLSGGNQQKVVLAKWLSTNPKVLIIDEPTRGIDVGTKSEVHRRMSDLAGQGLAILMVSSELPEVLGMADRVLVMYEGRITADIARKDATSETIMHAATHAPQEFS